MSDNIRQSYMTVRISKPFDMYKKTNVVEKGFVIAHIGYMLRGVGRFEFDGNSFELYPGEIVFTPPGIPYTSFWKGDPEIEYYVIEFETSLFTSKDFQFCKIRGNECYKKLFEDIYYDACEKDNVLSSIGNLYLLLSELERDLPSVSEQHSSMIYKAKKYVERHYDSEFSVSDLAEMSNLSESYFYNLFKEETGYSPVDYKNMLRIKQAVIYLIYKNYSLEQICEKLNFSSASHLRKIMLKFTGKTPSQIKKEHLSI